MIEAASFASSIQNASNPFRENCRKVEQGSDAFKLRYDSSAPSQAIRNDIESYLGEYRLQVQKYNFDLGYFDSHDGEGFCLRSFDDGESMRAKAHRGTLHAMNTNPGKVERRISEYKGIEEEEQIVQNALDGDQYIYFSPPDPNKEDEEGKYGFAYINKVVRNSQDSRVQKTAIRIESQNIEEYRNALSFLTGEDLYFEKPEHFIANPMRIHDQLTESDIDLLLSQFFNFQINQENQQRFEMIMKIMGNETTQFVEMMKLQYSPEDIQKAFFALENRALELKKLSLNSLGTLLLEKDSVNIQSVLREELFLSFVDQYGYIPPTVGGSCGSTSVESANIFGFGSAFSSLGFALPDVSSVPNEVGGDWKEVCVTCPYCQNKEKNLFNGQKYKCGSSICQSHRINI